METGWAKAAWGKLFGQMLLGTAIIQRETPRRFNLDTVFRIMERYGVTTFCAPAHGHDGPARSQAVQASPAPLHERRRTPESRGYQDLEGLLITCNLDSYDFYGQIETVVILANYPFTPLKYGSVGKPTPGHDVHIVDFEGKEFPASEEGSIAMKVDGMHPPGSWPST